MPTFTPSDAISPQEFRRWCDEAQAVPDRLDVSDLLNLLDAEVTSQNVALEDALRMQAIADKAIIEANRRAAAFSEVF